MFRRRLGALGLLLLGCGGPEAVTPSFANVQLTPPMLQLMVGTTYPLTVLAHDVDGRTLSPEQLSWATTDPRVVVTSSLGRVTAVGPGTARITASIGPARGASTISVFPAVLRGVRVTPGSAEVAPGAATPFRATGLDDAGNIVPLGTVAWSVDDQRVAVIDANGVARGIAAGLTTVRAFAQGQTGTAELRVAQVSVPVATVQVFPQSMTLPLGRRSQLSAVARDASGGLITGLPVSWVSAAPDLVPVSDSGLVTAVGEGVVIVSAIIGGVTGSTSVTVTPDVPPNADWPNEPPGFVPVSDQPWDLLTLSGWLLQFGTAVIGPDLAAPHSPPNVLTILFPIGFVGGAAPGTETLALPLLHQVYVGTWWKASDPWQGHPSNSNKVQYLFSNGDGSMAMIMYGHPGGPYELRVFPDWHGQWLTPNVAKVPVTLGVWHQIEWLVEYGPTQDPPSGRVRWWMDGQLLGDWQNVRLSALPLAQYKVAPVWGGAETVVKTELDYFWYDHTYVSGR